MKRSRTLSLSVAVAGTTLGAANAYLLILLDAARRRRSTQPSTLAETGRHRFLVVIPAHDEERILPRTLRSLAQVDHPEDRVSVVVVADNCSDGTARVAREAGARVLVRVDAERVGKGHALGWALERLRNEIAYVDAVVFLDADCECTPNLLSAFDARLRADVRVAQCAYLVANPADSWPSALRWAAFALMNVVRPLGTDALGVSCGLLGTGFMVTSDVLERVPWAAFSLAEDQEYHLRLIAAGERVRFVGEAAVLSPMPNSLAASREQNLRWEAGRWQLLRASAPLARDALRRRDRVRLHAAVEQLVPPQSVLFAGEALVVIAALLTRSRASSAIGLANVSAHALYVVGGLRLVGAPWRVYAALGYAPVLALWKVGLQVLIVAGRGPKDWIATRTKPRGGVG